MVRESSLKRLQQAMFDDVLSVVSKHQKQVQSVVFQLLEKTARNDP